MEIGAHILVTGLVQGVGFRYFANTRALSLGLRGYVKNLDDGGVEIEVEGDRSLIEEFIHQITVGPRAAQVTDVKVEWKKSDRHFHEFRIQ